jgi:hypothetical protein
VHGKRLTPKLRKNIPTVIGGFEQITGIGEKTAKQIVEYRDEHALKTWKGPHSYQGNRRQDR